MKAKVIIENGLTEIILLAENEFESEMIEKVEYNQKKFSVDTEFYVKKELGCIKSEHKISILISQLNR